MLVTIDGVETEVITDITEVSKEIYDKIYKIVIDNLKNFTIEQNVANFNITTSVLILILNHIFLKNPNYLFCVSYGVTNSNSIYAQTGLQISSKITYSYLTSKENIEQQTQFLNSVLQELNTEMECLKTDLDKILFICNYFKKENFTAYEFDGSTINDVYSVFYNKNANCPSYAYALGFLFAYFNIDYQYISYNSNNNFGISVYLNDEWYFIDIGVELFYSESCFVLKSLNNEMFPDGTTQDYFSGAYYSLLGTTWELIPNVYSTKYDWLKLR